MRVYLSPVRRVKVPKQLTTNVGVIVEKEEPSFTIVGNEKWSSHSGNEYGDSSIKVNINLPYDTIITLLVVRAKDFTSTYS